MFHLNEVSRQIGDSALDAAFGRSYGRLVSWCRRHVWRGLGEPEEFVHQAYLRSRRHWAEERRSTGREEAYFFKALRWVVADALRQRHRQRQGLADYRGTGTGAGASPVRELIAREAMDSVLTAREREVCAGLIRGRSTRQLCDELAVSPAALAVRACRARQKLSRFLGLLPEGPS